MSLIKLLPWLLVIDRIIWQLLDVALGLTYLHDMSVIHGDLKSVGLNYF